MNTLFIGLVAAVSLAFGLAFGLGGRDVAAELTRSWYEQSQETAAKVRAHTEGAAETHEPDDRRHSPVDQACGSRREAAAVASTGATAAPHVRAPW